MELRTPVPETFGHQSGLVAYGLLPADSPEQRTTRTAHRLYERLIQLWYPGIIEAAHDLGMFAALADRPATAQQLARSLGTDTHATRVMLEALVVLGMVASDVDCPDPVYRLPIEMRDCLLPGSIYSLAGKITHDRRLAWSAWRDLAARVRSNVPRPDDASEGNQITAEDYESLVLGINFWAPPIVDRLVTTLEALGWTDTQPRVCLDVGCGAGLYSQLLLQRYPRLLAIGFDVAKIIPLADQQAERLGVRNRFLGVQCDFSNTEWGSEFDLILFANIFHLQNRQTAQDLMLRASKAVSDDGVIAIADQIIDDRSESEQGRFAKLFAVSMLATGGGDAYRIEDYEEWMRASGLRCIALLDAPMHRILLARRMGTQMGNSIMGDPSG